MRLIMCEQKSVVGRERYILNRAAMAAKDTKDWSLPSFGSHLNPISTRGGRLCRPYTGVLGWLKFAVAALQSDSTLWTPTLFYSLEAKLFVIQFLCKLE